MDGKPRYRSRKCGAVAAFSLFCAALLSAAADAQDSTINRIEALERQIGGLKSEVGRQIGGLQSELRRLKSELGETKQQLRQSRSEAQRAQDELREAREAEAARMHQGALSPATSPSQAAKPEASTQAAVAVPAESTGVKVSMPEGRPTIATADGRASLAIGGLVQFDMGGYFQHVNQNTEFPHLNNGVNLRRGRLYFVGKFDDFRVNITPDFGGNPGGAPTLFEANLNYTGIKPVTFTVGYFHPFVSLEDATFRGICCFSSGRASSISSEAWPQVYSVLPLG